MFAAVRYSEDRSRQAVVVFNFSETKRRVRLKLGDAPAWRLRNYLSGEMLQTHGDALEVDLRIYGHKLFEVLG